VITDPLGLRTGIALPVVRHLLPHDRWSAWEVAFWLLPAACLVALPFVYVETCELNKAAGHCLLRRTGVLRARTISFPLSEITRVNIQIRDFGGGYRTGNPYAFRLPVTRTSGEEVTLNGWRSSPNVQRSGFAIAEFLGVPFDTTS